VLISLLWLYFFARKIHTSCVQQAGDSMKKSYKDCNTQLLNDTSGSNQSSQRKPTSKVGRFLRKIFLFCIRLLAVLIGLFIIINRGGTFAATGNAISLLLIPVGIALVWFGVGKTFLSSAATSVKKLIHKLAVLLGLLMLVGFFGTISSGESSKSFTCLALGLLFFIVGYVTRTPKKKSKETEQASQSKKAEEKESEDFDREELEQVIPELIKTALQQTHPELVCTDVPSITYEEERPQSAEVVLNTGEKIQIGIEVIGKDNFKITLPETLTSTTPQATDAAV
jgi:hypothetical protein